MTAPQPRDDPQRQRADGDGATVSTGDMLRAVDEVIGGEASCAVQIVALGGKAPLTLLRIAALRAAREVIVEAAPAICRACGELNPWWLLAGGTSVPCWGCGARHLATPPQNSADLPPADRATRQPTAAEVRVTGDGGR